MQQNAARDQYVRDLETRLAELKSKLLTERRNRSELEHKIEVLQTQLDLVTGTVNELSSALQESRIAYEKQTEIYEKQAVKHDDLMKELVVHNRRILTLLEGDQAGGIDGLCKTQKTQDERIKSLEQTRTMFYALGTIISFGYYFLEDHIKSLFKLK